MFFSRALDDLQIKWTASDASRETDTRVVTGGRISNRKGVSLPDTTIPVAAMTEKDRLDLEAGLAAGADWIAVSFVQRPEDVAEVKAVAQGKALVMAKQNIIVAGGTGSGKTSLLNALSSFIPPDDRIVDIDRARFLLGEPAAHERADREGIAGDAKPGEKLPQSLDLVAVLRRFGHRDP